MAVHAACTEEQLDTGHARERTMNMLSMSVTLDVSKLSGWLNADAPCRVTVGLTERHTRSERREGVGGAPRHVEGDTGD